ncbi:MAG: hypothetical protein AMXMBFR64_24280 [Myxococcales bacterium]
MSLGIRGRLFVISTVLLLVVLLGGGALLEGELRGWVHGRLEAELERQAVGVRSLLIHRPIDTASLGAILRDLTAESATRLTIMDGNGRVIADSSVDDREVPHLPSHAGRPEVDQALAQGRGAARRESATVGRDLLYVAIGWDAPEGRRVIRAARPLADEEEAVASLRRALVVAAAAAVVLATFMSWIASHLTLRTVRALVETARTIARARGGRVPYVEGELAGLARPIDALGRELEEVVDALARERNLTEAVLDGMSEAVIALDADLHVQHVNPSAVALLGARSSPVGRSLLELIRLPALQELATRSLESGSASVEVTLPGDGQRRVLARGTALGDRAGVVLVLHDVTELRRLETVRRDFVANVSHELRTPLSVIRANAETLLDGAMEDPARGRKFADGILRHADRLSLLVSDLLDISRIEAGRVTLELAPVPVARVVAAATGAVGQAAARKDIVLANEVHPSLEALADARGLEQVLINLLDNAVKYTPAGGHAVVRAASEGPGRILIEVEDDGPGIEPRHRARIFERFYRVDPGRSRDMGGTGLGLSIVKHMVEAMGGRVGVRPGPERGSIFWVSLPRP